jgi:hypothetical protein
MCKTKREFIISSDIIKTTISMGFTGNNINKMDYDLLLLNLSKVMLLYCWWDIDTGLPIPIPDKIWNRVIVQIPEAYNSCKTQIVTNTIDKLNVDVVRVLCKLVRDLQKKIKSSNEFANVLSEI